MQVNLRIPAVKHKHLEGEHILHSCKTAAQITQLSQQGFTLYNVSVMKQAIERVRKPDIRKATLAGLREGYFNLGFVLFGSAMTTLITFGLAWIISVILRPFAAWQLPFYLIPMLAGWLCSVGVYDYAYKGMTHEHPVVMDAMTAIRDLMRPALLLFVTDLFITLVVISDLVYCWMLAMSKGGLALTALAVFCFYLLIIWTMMTLYHLPLLVDGGKEATVAGILKRAFILTFGNPVFTLMLFLAIIAFALICALPAFAGWVALLVGGCAFFCCSAVKELFISYGLTPDDPTEPEDKGWRVPEKK